MEHRERETEVWQENEEKFALEMSIGWTFANQQKKGEGTRHEKGDKRNLKFKLDMEKVQQVFESAFLALHILHTRHRN